VRAHRRTPPAVDHRRRSGHIEFPDKRGLRPGRRHSLGANIRQRLSDATGISLENAEPLQGQHHAVGQEFKPHTDTFNPGGADYIVNCAESGQRTWTAMIYLNEPQDGGATRFKRIGKTIQPEIGKLLVWNNLLPDGTPNNATLHQGVKVRRGTKYILTQWYRERPLGGG
jgi:prolyl 4-hydroxylase